MSSTSSVIDVVPVPLVPPVKLSSALVIFCMGSSAVTLNCRLASTSCVSVREEGAALEFQFGNRTGRRRDEDVGGGGSDDSARRMRRP